MTDSSTRAHNGSNISSNETTATTSGTQLVDDHDPSYSLNRFLTYMDQNHPPGHGPAQSPAEAQKRMQQKLRNFDDKFSSSSDPPHRS